MKASIEVKVSFDAQAASDAMREYMEKSAGRMIDAPSLAEYIRVGIAAGCRIEDPQPQDNDDDVHADDAIASHAHRVTDYGHECNRSMPFHYDPAVQIEGRAWRDTTVDFVLQGNDYATFVECWRVFGRGWKFDDNSASAVLAARAWKARDEICWERVKAVEETTRMEEREKKAGTLRDYYEMTHALIPLHQCYVLLPEWQKFETVPSAPGRVIDLDRNLRENIHRLRGTGSQKDAERRALRSLFVDWLRMVDDMEKPAPGEGVR